MSGAAAERGCIAVAPLVGAMIGAVVVAGLTMALAQAARWVVRANARAETHDTADLVAQAFTFDLRSAGWDPTGASGARLAYASPTELELQRDRDGDGVIDPASAERLRWRWVAATRTMSRLVGAQSMPLASTAVGAVFTFRDAAGARVPASAAGLAPGELARVQSVELAITLAPPGGGALVRRTAAVALRGGPS
jgi:hypothetical protein